MSPEEKELLQRSVSLAEENNAILRSMRRAQRWSNITRVIYWIFIIGSAVGAYYLIEPYVDGFTDMYSTVSDGLKDLNR